MFSLFRWEIGQQGKSAASYIPDGDPTEIQLGSMLLILPDKDSIHEHWDEEHSMEEIVKKPWVARALEMPDKENNTVKIRWYGPAKQGLLTGKWRELLMTKKQKQLQETFAEQEISLESVYLWNFQLL